jgi:putative glycosyltransferase (TIGR04372 family)
MRVLAKNLGVAIGLIAIAILWMIEPFWRFRFGIIRANRLGHLAAGPEILMRKWQLYGRPSRTTFILFATDPCNETLFSMWKRKLRIVENRWANRLIHHSLPVLSKSRFYIHIVDNSCHYLEMKEGKPCLSFTPEEEEKGKAALAAMGIGENDWFACIYARDPSYLQTKGETEGANMNRYRDCSIENFIDAAQLVSQSGGYVLRMGAAVDKPLPATTSSRIIDYASTHRSDFLDIFLSAKCRFFIGCCSGLTDVPAIFLTPTIWTNYVLNSVADGDLSIFMPKFLRYKSNGVILTYLEISNLGIFPTESDPEEALNYMHYDVERLAGHPDIEWVENDAEDVLGAVKDMMDMLEWRNELFLETEHIHKAFLAFYNHSPHNSPYAARLSPRFALRHKALILGRD